MSTQEFLKNRILIQYLMRYVNYFSSKAQLQDFRLYKKKGKLEANYLIYLDFFSRVEGPFSFLVSFENGEPHCLPCAKKELGEWETKAHPLSLYLKAHLVGKLCRGIEFLNDENAVLFLFSEETKLKMQMHSNFVRVELIGVAKKSFSKEILLDTFAREAVLESKLDNPLKENEAKNTKYKKLLEHVEGDLQEAKSWLEKMQTKMESLRQDPSLWGNSTGWTESEIQEWEELIGKHHWPRFLPQTRSLALEKIFSMQKRMQRKLEKAGARLAQIKTEEPLLKSRQSQAPKTSNAALREKKGPGLIIEPLEGLKIWIGKSAQDNEALFKKFRDRDLWFHVRGWAGAHVWIPRGQKHFPKKSEPSEKILDLGSQIALINSKLKDSRQGEVDIAERRFLKKGRNPGELFILKSSVRKTLVDESLLSRIFPKKV